MSSVWARVKKLKISKTVGKDHFAEEMLKKPQPNTTLKSFNSWGTLSLLCSGNRELSEN